MRLMLLAVLLSLTAAVSVARCRRFLFPLRRIFFEDAVLNFLLVGIPDLTVALVGYGVRVFIVCSDCDGSFLLRLTEPDMTVRLPRALDSVSAELLLGAKPPKMVSCVLCSATRCSRRLRQ